MVIFISKLATKKWPWEAHVYARSRIACCKGKCWHTTTSRKKPKRALLNNIIIVTCYIIIHTFDYATYEVMHEWHHGRCRNRIAGHALLVDTMSSWFAVPGLPGVANHCRLHAGKYDRNPNMLAEQAGCMITICKNFGGRNACELGIACFL